MMANYKTLGGFFRYEPDKVKGSRHIGSATPIAGEAEVAPFLERVRKELPGAGHHAFAWRLTPEGTRFRYSDDGEPSGSAGKPMLQQISSRGLSDVLVVVTRYFGGTKLGVGGLMRAYGGACGAVLDRAPLRTITLTTVVTLRYAYALSNIVAAVTAGAGLAPRTGEYSDSVTAIFDVPDDQVEGLVTALRDRSANRIEIEFAERSE